MSRTPGSRGAAWYDKVPAMRAGSTFVEDSPVQALVQLIVRKSRVGLKTRYTANIQLNIFNAKNEPIC